MGIACIFEQKRTFTSKSGRTINAFQPDKAGFTTGREMCILFPISLQAATNNE